jgi:hypothetical protein
MKNIDLSAIIQLAKLKNDKPEEYETLRSSIKEVFKDIAKLESEIMGELEIEIEEKKKKEKYELNLLLAEKMKRDRPKM